MPRRDYTIFSRIGKSPETYYGDSKPHSELPEPAAQEIRRVLRSLTARAAILNAAVLGDTETIEIIATDEVTGALLDRACTRGVRDLSRFVRRNRGALFTLHVWCRPVLAERVKAVLGAPALYDSMASGGRVRISYPAAGAAARKMIVPANGETYVWCGPTVSFPHDKSERAIIRDVLLVVTVRSDAPRNLRPSSARGSTPQLPHAF
jgi:hypothetical protein